MEDKQKKAAYPFRLEPDLLKKGKELASKRGISLAGLLRQLLIRELENEEKR
jgi:hypothetical protein